MITSKDCIFQENCKKYLNGNTDCINNDIYCPRLYKLNALYKNSLLSPIQYKQVKLKASCIDGPQFEKLVSIENNIEEFVLNANNLYIHSLTTGNGKTSWAIRLLKSYLNTIWYKSSIDCKALFINIPRFLLALKASIAKNDEYVNFIKENIYNADIVVWDEVGTKIATEFETENLYAMIDGRIDLGKSNIYTSNITPDELKVRLGDRLYSRIIQLSVDIEFMEQDKRGGLN